MGFDAGGNKCSYAAKGWQLRNLVDQVNGDADRYKEGCGIVHIHHRSCGLVLYLHCSHSCLVSPCVGEPAIVLRHVRATQKYHSHILNCLSTSHYMLLFWANCIRDKLLRRSMSVASLNHRLLYHYKRSQLLTPNVMDANACTSTAHAFGIGILL